MKFALGISIAADETVSIAGIGSAGLEVSLMTALRDRTVLTSYIRNLVDAAAIAIGGPGDHWIEPDTDSVMLRAFRAHSSVNADVVTRIRRAYPGVPVLVREHAHFYDGLNGQETMLPLAFFHDAATTGVVLEQFLRASIYASLALQYLNSANT